MHLMDARPWLVDHPRLSAALRAGLRATYRYQRRFIPARGELPFVLNAMGLTGAGVEIGVRDGSFSSLLLGRWRGRTLHSVDPWLEDAAYVAEGGLPVPQSNHDGCYQNAMRALAPFGARSVVHRTRSLDAARTFADGSLDFCYIDAQHEYEHVRHDLVAWFPKIVAGGIFAGHDYMDGVMGGVDYGVKRAVDEFCLARNLDVVVSHESDTRSWFVFL